MARRAAGKGTLDTELADLPPDLRWREWMARVEAVIFASPEPVGREALARVVGRGCNLDLIIDDIRAELRGRPYELVSVAGGWQHRTRKAYGEAIRSASGDPRDRAALSQAEALVLTAIGYFQPITRGELSRLFGKEIGRDLIAGLRAAGLIGPGPRSPQPGAPYTYVTTRQFLLRFGFETLRDLPDMERLEDAGLLSKERLLAGDLGDGPGFGSTDPVAEAGGGDQDDALD